MSQDYLPSKSSKTIKNAVATTDKQWLSGGNHVYTCNYAIRLTKKMRLANKKVLLQTDGTINQDTLIFGLPKFPKLLSDICHLVELVPTQDCKVMPNGVMTQLFKVFGDHDDRKIWLNRESLSMILGNCAANGGFFIDADPNSGTVLPVFYWNNSTDQCDAVVMSMREESK